MAIIKVQISGVFVEEVLQTGYRPKNVIISKGLPDDASLCGGFVTPDGNLELHFMSRKTYNPVKYNAIEVSLLRDFTNGCY